MSSELYSIQFLVFVLISPLLLLSCSNDQPLTREEYHNTLIDWPYRLLAAYRKPYHGDPHFDNEDANKWVEFDTRFHDLLHDGNIEYIEYEEGHVAIYVKAEDCRRAMSIINRHIKAGELHTVHSWDEMLRKDDRIFNSKFVPLKPGFTFGYNAPGHGRACPSIDQKEH